jgi:hypothetical protein
MGALAPIGKIVYEFQNNNEYFEIRLVTHNDDGSCELLSACEKIAMWFIETADAVDFMDNKWEALFCYKLNHASTTSTTSTATNTTASTTTNTNASNISKSINSTNNYVGRGGSGSPSYAVVQGMAADLVGYMTLYTFTNPVVGEKIRVS